MTSIKDAVIEKYAKILRDSSERDPRESMIGFCVEDGDYLSGTAGCYYFYWLMKEKDLTRSILHNILSEDDIDEFRSSFPDAYVSMIKGKISDNLTNILHKVTGDINRIIWIGTFDQLVSDANEFPEIVRSNFHRDRFIEQYQDNLRQELIKHITDRGGIKYIDEKYRDIKILFPEKIIYSEAPILEKEIDSFITFIRSLNEPREGTGVCTLADLIPNDIWEKYWEK